MDRNQKTKPKHSKPSTKNRPRSIPELQLATNITYIMDQYFQIPGTKIRFGLDPILGLFPWIGDIVGAVISMMVVLSVLRYGISGKVLLLMIGNIVLDASVGAIPLLGDVFDFTYKTNQRNFNLLKEHLEEGKHTGSGLNIIIGAVAISATILGLIFYVLWKLLSYFIH